MAPQITHNFSCHVGTLPEHAGSNIATAADKLWAVEGPALAEAILTESGSRRVQQTNV